MSSLFPLPQSRTVPHTQVSHGGLLSFTGMENPLLLFSLFWAEGDIDILLDKFHQENQGHIPSSLTASSVTKSASLDVGGAPACTSE